MSGEEFLTYAGQQYLTNKKKWSYRLSKMGLNFSEDILQDSVIKVFEVLQKHEIEDDKIEGFWYQSFLNNTKRDKEYAYNSKRDDGVNVLSYLDEKPNDDPPILLEDIREGINKLTDIEKHLLIIYYLTDLSIIELETLTEIKDLRYKIQKIVKKIKTKV